MAFSSSRPDEAYYYLWSLHPALSYYSKGPGVAATIWLSTHVFGPTEFGIRFFSPLLSLITSLLMFRLARRMYSEEIAIWTTVALSCVPIYHVGGLLMTIDPLSMCFWMAALYTCWRALERSPEFSAWWPVTGALIGLGFLCKWTNAMQLLSILLLLALTPKYRRELKRAGFWSMLGAFVPFTAPPIYWNSNNEWITLSHLGARAGLEKAFRPDPLEFLKVLGGQFGVYSPVIFAAMLATIWMNRHRARLHFKPRFLLAFALPILILYFILSLREAGEANWTAPATLSLGLLTVATFHELASRRRWVRKTAAAGLAIGVVMSFLALDTDALRKLKLPIPYENDPSTRLRGWRTTAEIADAFRQRFESQTGAPVFLIANKYQTASSLSYYMKNGRSEGPGHPPVYIPESQFLENQFSFWPRYDEMTEIADVAKDFLSSSPSDSPFHRSVANALEHLSKEETTQPEQAIEARRTLVHELHQALPQLPLDESYVEEAGLSLFAGRNALYITDRAEERAPSTIKGGFERVEMVGCIDLNRRDLPLRQIRIFACYNYHGISL